MMSKKMIENIGIVATAISLGVTLLSNWVDEKKMEEKIEEKVNEALESREKNNYEES